MLIFKPLGKRSSRTPRCRGGTDARPCRSYPGEGTPHAGLGFCRGHSDREAEEAWRVALDVARELDVSPWEALLLAVRRAAGRVAWVDEQLTLATRENDGNPAAQPVLRWLAESRKERALLARTAKAAVDAGVAERLVRQVELEGRVVAEVLGRVLDRLELGPDQRVAAFEAAQEALLVIEGEVG